MSNPPNTNVWQNRARNNQTQNQPNSSASRNQTQSPQTSSQPSRNQSRSSTASPAPMASPGQPPMKNAWAAGNPIAGKATTTTSGNQQSANTKSSGAAAGGKTSGAVNGSGDKAAQANEVAALEAWLEASFHEPGVPEAYKMPVAPEDEKGNAEGESGAWGTAAGSKGGKGRGKKGGSGMLMANGKDFAQELASQVAALEKEGKGVKDREDSLGSKGEEQEPESLQSIIDKMGMGPRQL